MNIYVLLEKILSFILGPDLAVMLIHDMECGVNYLTVIEFKSKTTCRPRDFRKGMVELLLIPILLIKKMRCKEM